MPDKLNMTSKDIIQENIEYIAKRFPNALKEVKGENGKLVSMIDFDVLKQELSNIVIDDKQERYQMTWPDKKKSILLANSKINSTLRPVKEKSVDFDNTKNLYIEGDNLEVLKLLRETYLNKVKMIYIDPPYNTGNNFVYEDDFAQSLDEYLENSGQYDNQGNKLFTNSESNGRFHTDWLNMMYPRLKIAKDLLMDDGVIFASIDDNEYDNLIKVCNEIFGEKNYIGTIVWEKKRKGSFLSKRIVSMTEYCVVFCKNVNSNMYLYGGKADSAESQPIIKRTNALGILKFKANTVKTKLSDGVYRAGTYGEDINPVKLLNDVCVKNGVISNDFDLEAHFTWSQSFLNNELQKGTSVVINTNNFQPRVFRVLDENSFKGLISIINGVEISGTNEDAYEELEKIFGIKNIFDYSKPKNYISRLIESATHFDKDAIIMDFFSGSASTAHATFVNNLSDNGNRKFILVQLPENRELSSEAKKAGFNNICEIGEERIRRAGKKILDKYKKSNQSEGLFVSNDDKPNLDIGFRVLKLDSSNMNDVYYNANATSQSLFDNTVDNVKSDRTPLDLLFQVMLELGIELSAKIEEKEISGKKYFVVNENDIVACFDSNVNNDVIKELAQIKPIYAVFRDSVFENDSANINCEQLFKTISPSTTLKVL